MTGRATPYRAAKYRTIVADPPWHYDAVPATLPSGRNKIALPGKPVGKPLAYPTMSLQEIAALPLPEIAAADARLFLWATNRYLPDAFRLLGGWGFRYSQTLVWHKLNVPPFGGSVARQTVEFLLVAVRGRPRRVGIANSALIATGVQKVHSRKPDAWLDLVEQVSPGPYVELFARRNRLGWDTWGNESLEHVDVPA